MKENLELILKTINKVTRELVDGNGYSMLGEDRFIWSTNIQTGSNLIVNSIYIDFDNNNRSVTLYAATTGTDNHYKYHASTTAKPSIDYNQYFPEGGLAYKFKWREKSKYNELYKQITKAHYGAIRNDICKTIDKLLPGFIEEELILGSDSDS